MSNVDPKGTDKRDTYPDAPGVHDADRLAKVHAFGLLDTPAEEAFDRMTLLAARLLNAPTSAVTIVDDHRQFFKSAYGLDEPWATTREMPLFYSYCQYSLHDPHEPLVINDARESDLFSKSGALTENKLVAYAGVPLVIDGSALGALCVVDTHAREWTGEQIEMLSLLAQSVTTEIKLRHELARRHEIERMKDEFMSVVGHELRTPLTSIRASLGMLASGKVVSLPPEGQRLFDVAVRNSDRLLRLLNDVIDVERLTTGRIEMHMQECDVREIMLRAVESVEGLADQAGVKLHAEGIHAKITCDDHRIGQVLTNLLSNAIKFSKAGQRVSMSARRVDDQIEISVTDEGRGIPAEKLESIFERFEQVESADTRTKGGAGLGLAIAKGIVERHHGEIWAESEWGKGTTFRVRLPASDPA